MKENIIYSLYIYTIAITNGESANLQDNNVRFSRREKVSTKYGDIILCFWKDSEIQNL